MLEYAIAMSENTFFKKNMENLEYGAVIYSKSENKFFLEFRKC